MAITTVEDVRRFLTRVRDTAYLPDWANETAAEILTAEPGLVQGLVSSVVDGVYQISGKWCPFVRAVNQYRREPANRVLTVNAEKMTVDRISVAGSLCIGNGCMMWNDDKKACGLSANPLVTMMQEALDAQASPADGA